MVYDLSVEIAFLNLIYFLMFSPMIYIILVFWQLARVSDKKTMQTEKKTTQKREKLEKNIRICCKYRRHIEHKLLLVARVNEFFSRYT